MRVLSLDTEFRGSQNRNITPVCAVIQMEGVEQRYWFPEQRTMFLSDWEALMRLEVGILCYYGSAEARFLQSCGYTVRQLLSWKWLDSFVMWRMLTHSHPAYRFGRKIIKVGTTKQWITTTPPPDGVGEDTWEEDDSGQPVSVKKVPEKHKTVGSGLAAAVGHQFGIDLDSDHKLYMRDVILSRSTYTEEEKEAILSYCSSDVDHLLNLHTSLSEALKKETLGAFTQDDLMNLSRYMVCCGIMEGHGIPIHVDKAQTLGTNYAEADLALIKGCNAHYPFYTLTPANKKQRAQGMGDTYWKEDYSKFEAYIKDCGLLHLWPRSEKSKALKKDKDTLSDYRGDPVIARLRTCKKSRAQLKYFRPEGWLEIQKQLGADGRIRVLLSPFGSKTGRNQPSVKKGYLFGMSTWLRPLIGQEGKVIVGADFSAQEIGLQAWVSGDDKFMDAYLSGDPYTWMASFAGVFPEGTSRTHGAYLDAEGAPYPKEDQIKFKGIRETFKALMLGLGFGMGLTKLAAKMSQSRIAALPQESQEILFQSRVTPYEGNEGLHNQAGEIFNGAKVVVGYSDTDMDYPELQRASTYKNHHASIFHKYWAWRESAVRYYRDNGFWNLADGWCLLEGEPRDTSVGNFPVQGTGGAILRRAVERCLWAGLEVVSPLHDCIYILSDPDKTKEDGATLVHEMRAAVQDICGESFIRIEAKEYSTDWVNFTSTWTEEKQGAEFAEYGKYMVSARQG
jgi:hypothetical protein